MSRLFILILCACLYPLQSWAAPSFEYSVKECKNWVAENPPEIEVLYNYGDLHYDYEKSPDEIKQIYLEDNPNGVVERIRGLTQLSARASVSIDPETVMLKSERYCTYAKKIEVKLLYTPVVYISNQLEKDSCQFNLTMRHEQTHLQFGHQALRDAAKDMSDNLQQYIETNSPFVSKDDYEADEQKVVQIYTNKVEQIFNDFRKNLEKQNSRIDTTENYKKEASYCRD